MSLPMTNIFVVDCETLGLEARWNVNLPVYLTCIITVDENGSKKIYRHRETSAAIEHIRKLLNDGWVFIAHNAKFELAVFNSRGLGHLIEKGKLSVVCTQVMEYIRNSGLSSYSLDALTGMKTDVIQQLKDKGLIAEGMGKKDFWNTDWSNEPEVLAVIEDYCVDDCKATLKLYLKLCAWYNRPEHSKYVGSLLDLEFPMLSVLAHMEVNGIHIDTKELDRLTSDCRATLYEHKSTLDSVAKFLPKLQWNADEDDYVPVEKEYKKEVYKNVGNVRHYMAADGSIVSSNPYIVGSHCELLPYNPAAATGHTYWLIKQQCPELLEKAEQTPKGKPKLDKDFFTDVADEMPENLPIANYLKAVKSLQMCVSIAEHIRDGDRIHGSFNNCLTRTARLSSNEPNLQNIKRSDEDAESVGSRFRQVFSAPDGKVMLVADLDRIELVVLGWYLKVAMRDSNLADVCSTPGIDPHQVNADRWGVGRTVAKTLIFLLVYGGGAGLIFRRGMAKTLAEAESMVKQVDEAQPAINKLKQSVWEKCRQRGYITNPFNARGVYPELYSKQWWIRGAGERKAFNFLIQRTARDVLHTLLVQMFPIVLKYGARISLIIHDEVVIECDKSVAEDLMRELQVIWGRRDDILKGVIINGDWHAGDSWYSAKG